MYPPLPRVSAGKWVIQIFKHCHRNVKFRVADRYFLGSSNIIKEKIVVWVRETIRDGERASYLPEMHFLPVSLGLLPSVVCGTLQAKV